MTRFIISYKTRLLSMTGALFFSCVSFAQAQTANETSQLLNRINQLENQVQTLNQAVYRGAPLPAGAATSARDTAATANAETRMSAIEDQQRKITGQIEKIAFDLQQLKDRVEHMQADNEQRFQQVEHSAASVPAPAGSTAPAATTAPASAGGTLGTLNLSGDGNNGPAESLYEGAFSSLRDTKYEDAETKFKQFLSQYPGHPLAANAQYWLGETYYVRGDYKQAAKTFAQGYQDFPKSAKAADSLFKLGLSLSKLGKKDDACLSLRQLQKEFQSEAGPLQRKAQAEIKTLECP
jgi:tol-pal system protein YbgF